MSLGKRIKELFTPRSALPGLIRMRGGLRTKVIRAEKNLPESGETTIVARLYAKKISAEGDVVDYGLVSQRVVTDAFVNYLVDAMQDSTTYPMDVFKYHDSGTGTTSEDASDTTLESPCGESRDTGTQEEGASSNIYKTVATHTYSGSFAITEHGVFSAATGGT